MVGEKKRCPPTARSGNGPSSHKELRKGKRSKSEDRKQKRVQREQTLILRLSDKQN